MPFVLKSSSQQPVTAVRPRPALTDFWNNRRGKLCHSFQKSIPAARHGRPSTARPHGPLWRTSETIGVGSYAIRFKSPSQRPVTDARPRPAPTARSDGLLKQSAWEAMPFVSKVHPSGPSRTPVHGPPPRPALTDFWNNRREELVPFVWKVHPSGPSRLSVHGPPPRPALTDFWNNRREELVPFVSKVHPSGPSRLSVHGPTPRPALVDFCNNRREESVPFVSKVHPSRPSRTSVHGRLPRPALTDFWNNRRKEAVPFVSKVHPSGPSRPALTNFWNKRRPIRPRQNGRRFPDDVFKCIFLNENISTSIKISLKFVPKVPILQYSSIGSYIGLAPFRRQAIIWTRQWWLVYWRIYASLGLNELTENASEWQGFYLHLNTGMCI